MTADVVWMPPALLEQLTSQLLAIPEVAAVFYDLTHKPPGTIEWE
jgi:GMP synthase (glutamine-hydrolysing)